MTDVDESNGEEGASQGPKVSTKSNVLESVVGSIVWNHFTKLKSESGSKSAELLAIGLIWIRRLMEQNNSVH